MLNVRNPVGLMMSWSLATLVLVIVSGTAGPEGDKHVVVQNGPNDLAAMSGHNAELTCHINITESGKSHLIQWIAYSERTGGRPVSLNGKMQAIDIPNKFFISSTKPYNLHILDVDIDDAGKYTCNNVHVGMPVEDLDHRLVVFDPACPPEILTYKENDEISVSCHGKYAGNRDDSQKPTTTWTLNGTAEIAEAYDNTPGMFGSTFHKTASRLDDQQELNCSIKVLNIIKSCSTRLDIQYAAQKPALSVNGDPIEDKKDLQFSIGADVKLRGISRGNPQPVYTWTFTRTNTSNATSEESGDRMQIDNIKLNQAGIYRCCAKNKVNNVAVCSELTLRVIGKALSQGCSGNPIKTTDRIIWIVFLFGFLLLAIVIVILVIQNGRQKRLLNKHYSLVIDKANEVARA